MGSTEKKRGRFSKAFYSRETDFLRETHLSYKRREAICHRNLSMNGFWPRQSVSLTGRRNYFFLTLGHLITNRRYQEGLGGIIIFMRGLQSQFPVWQMEDEHAREAEGKVTEPAVGPPQAPLAQSLPA